MLNPLGCSLCWRLMGVGKSKVIWIYRKEQGRLKGYLIFIREEIMKIVKRIKEEEANL